MESCFYMLNMLMLADKADVLFEKYCNFIHRSILLKRYNILNGHH